MSFFAGSPVPKMAEKHFTQHSETSSIVDGVVVVPNSHDSKETDPRALRAGVLRMKAVTGKSMAVAQSMALGSRYGTWFPLPATIRAKMRYADRITINPPTGGLLATQVFSANGMYDPDITGTGHQPKGFDELIALYDHAVVKKAHIRVQPTSAANVIFGVSVDGSNTASFSNPSDYMELPHTDWRISASLVSSGAWEPHGVETSVDVAKFLGVKDLTDGREYATSNAANPTEDLAFHVWAAAADGSSDPGLNSYWVEITYECVFIEPRSPGQS